MNCRVHDRGLLVGLLAKSIQPKIEVLGMLPVYITELVQSTFRVPKPLADLAGKPVRLILSS